MTAATLAIETRGLSKTFGHTEALAPLDLVIPRGSGFALVGHNGAGKTTLIKLLLNILQPTHGSATVLGESTAALNGESFTHIGYVSENQEFPEWMTVQAMMNYLRPFYPTWNAVLSMRRFTRLTNAFSKRLRTTQQRLPCTSSTTTSPASTRH